MEASGYTCCYLRNVFAIYYEYSVRDFWEQRSQFQILTPQSQVIHNKIPNAELLTTTSKNFFNFHSHLLN